MGLKQGDVAYIKWPGRQSFNWRLTASAPKPGDTRELAAEAVLGANHVGATSYEDYWSYYIMPSDGKLRVASSATRSVRVYREDGSIVSSGNENTTAPALSKGEKVFIHWRTRGSGNFNWNLAVSPSAPGDACTLAAEAVSGNNYLPNTPDQYYWYRYTMPRKGKLQITSSATHDQNLHIYRSCNDTDYYYGYGNVTVYDFDSGEEVLIRWATSRESGFNWDLAVAPFGPGEDCTTAVSATKGTLRLPSTTADHYWYKFTMPDNGRLKITSSSTKDVAIYQGACSDLGNPAIDYGNGVVFSKGQEVLIRWDADGTGDFDWDLSVTPLGVGEDCRTAVPAFIGTNNFPSTSYYSHWYTYTMFGSGNLRIRSFTSKNIYIYRNTCDDLILEAIGEGNINVTGLKKGDQVFIEWEGHKIDFDWDLTETRTKDGDLCSSAVEASLGTNKLPATYNNFYWYRYTMPIDGKLQITSSSSEYINVFGGTCDTRYSFNEGRYGNTTVAPLRKGDQVFIRWELWYGGDFDWNLSVGPLEPGDHCALAAAATDGINNTPAAPYWFKYQVPATGSYTISSLGTATGNNHLSVYSDCHGTLLGENGNHNDRIRQRELTLSFTAGKVVYIYWDDRYSDAGFDWMLSSGTQAITFDPLPAMTVADAPFNLAATASSGLSVTYTSSDKTVATISGSTVTIVGVGATTITASQEGDATHDAAAPVAQLLSVTKASQTITVDVIADQLIDASPITLNASTTSGLALNYTVTGPATISGNIITLNGTEGIVQVTVSQAGNYLYQAVSANVSFNVTDPHPTVAECGSLTVTVAEKSNVTCSGALNGSLTVSATGGQTPYRYSVDGTTFQEAAHFVVLDSGNYLITVKDMNECTATVEAHIITPNILLVEGQVNPSTESFGNGRIALSMSGGTAPYRYTWSNNATTATIADLMPGDYAVTITDAQGCTVSSSFTVAEERVTSVEEQQGQKIAVYPNPIYDVLHVDVPFGSKVKEGTLYDPIGKKVAVISLTEGQNQVDAPMLKPGSYLLRLDNGSSRRILVK